MVDFVESVEVLTHETGSIGCEEEVPVFPLRIAESLRGQLVLLREVKVVARRDLVG